jgi:hypothetical protein
MKPQPRPDASAPGTSKPAKVSILLAQSNMLGMAKARVVLLGSGG